MKIKLVIASQDKRYMDCITDVLTEKYNETFELCVCSTAERFSKLGVESKFDVALVENVFVEHLSDVDVAVPLILYDEIADNAILEGVSYNKISKYQRISSIVEQILGNCTELKGDFSSNKGNGSKITAIWSPCGGVGKTTVALAYATRKSLSNQEVLYLNLEKFSSTSVYFEEDGQSISGIFQKMDSNLDLVIKGVKKTDSVSGVSYFCKPENYDDMNQLSEEDIEVLVKTCASNTKELIVDLSSVYDATTEKVLDLADRIYIICDTKQVSKAKMKQFMSQHSVWENIRKKSIVVANKGANLRELGIETYPLPLVKSLDDINVYKTLSAENFER